MTSIDAKLIFVSDLKTENDFDEFSKDIESQCDAIIRASKLLEDLDIDSKEDAEEVFNRLNSNQSTSEWWAFLAGTFNAIARDAVTENNAMKAAWAMRAAERCRAMYIFKDNLEEVVWMGPRHDELWMSFRSGTQTSQTAMKTFGRKFLTKILIT